MANYTQLRRADIVKLTEDFDVGTVTTSHPMEGGNENSSFFVQTPKGKYILSVFDRKTQQEVQNLVDVLVQLEKYEFPTTRLAQSELGYIATFDEKPVILKHYIDGNVEER